MDSRRNRRSGDAGRSKATRARKLAAEGAYRKAVVGLTSAAALFTPEDEGKWARELLPNSERQGGSLSQDGQSGRAADNPVPAASAGEALDGVRFAALSAPGLSGTRTEHLKDAIFERARGVASQLRGALSELYAVASSGALANCVRWILDSRLGFLKKKSGLAPRPFRVGEFWRRFIRKKLVHETRSDAHAVFLAMRQFGIACSCGTDVLVHFRGVFETELKEALGMVLACLDLGLKKKRPLRSNGTAFGLLSQSICLCSLCGRRGATRLRPWCICLAGGPSSLTVGPSRATPEQGEEMTPRSSTSGTWAMARCSVDRTSLTISLEALTRSSLLSVPRAAVERVSRALPGLPGRPTKSKPLATTGSLSGCVTHASPWQQHACPRAWGRHWRRCDPQRSVPQNRSGGGARLGAHRGSGGLWY